MNTKRLQDQYKKNYEEFFQQHELILSCPFVTNRSGDILGNYAGVSLRQKIPLRMYIGISTSFDGCELGDITYYDVASKCFLKKKIISYGSYFSDILRELGPEIGDMKFKINILSECSQSLGLGFTSIFSMLLLTTVQYLKQLFTKEELYEGKKGDINSTLQSKNNLIRNLFKQAMFLDTTVLNKCGYTSKICSFFDGAYPVIGFRQDNGYGYTNTKYNMNFYGFRINDLWPDIGSSTYFPYDFNIIYTGKPFIIENINQAHLNRLLFNEAKEVVYNVFKPICGNLSPLYKPRFFKQLIEPEIDIIGSVYGKMVGSISIEILYMFKEILSKQYSEQGLNNFLYSLNKFKLANNLTRNNSTEFLRFINNLESFLDSGNSHIAVFPNDTTISGGCLSLVSPIESSRNRIMNFIDQYNPTSSDNNVSLIYTSWNDDIESDGIKIEQDVGSNMISGLSKGVQYKIINRDSSVFLTGYQEAILNTSNDIVVDLIKNKIHILGKICNSNELNSQSTTAELISKVLLNKSVIINSKELGSSSYTKNKSEMISKVISPFVKLVKVTLDKNIRMQCSGYASNYTIECDFKDVKIGILKDL